MKKILFAFYGVFLMFGAYASDLVGTASVRMTSDTATTAKTMAINDARRQILIDKLKPYAMAIPSSNVDLPEPFSPTKKVIKLLNFNSLSASFVLNEEFVFSEIYDINF